MFFSSSQNRMTLMTYCCISALTSDLIRSEFVNNHKFCFKKIVY